MTMNPETFPDEVATLSLGIGNYTTSEDGEAVDISDFLGKLKISLNAEAAPTGSDTLDVTIEDSENGSTGWEEVAAFEQVDDSGDSIQSLNIDTRETRPFIRAVFTAAGSGTVASVTATGKEQVTA